VHAKKHIKLARNTRSACSVTITFYHIY